MWAMLMSKYRTQCLCMVMIIVALSAWISGYRTARYQYQSQISSLQKEYADETAQREQQTNQQLQAALIEQQKWQQFAQQQSVQLAQIRTHLDKQSELLNKEIHHAIEQDKKSGNDCVGLGDNSLQLYNRAFGYSD